MSANFARAESRRSNAQSAYDSQSPQYETDAEQALREWVEACPVSLTGFQEHDILMIAGRGW